MLPHDLAVVGTSGGASADPERLAAEGAVRGGHQHLRGDFLLTFIVTPGELSQTAAGAGVRIRRHREAGLQAEEHRNRHH